MDKFKIGSGIFRSEQKDLGRVNCRYGCVISTKKKSTTKEPRNADDDHKYESGVLIFDVLRMWLLNVDASESSHLLFVLIQS